MVRIDYEGSRMRKLGVAYLWPQAINPPSLDLAAMEHSARGGHSMGGRGDISRLLPPAGSGIPRSLRLFFAIFAGSSVLTLVFVSEIYRPPLPFLASICRDSTPQNSKNGRDRDSESFTPSSSGITQEISKDASPPAAVAPSIPTATPASGLGKVSESWSWNAYENAPSSSEIHDKLLGGLLSAEFDDSSCVSRYRLAAYRRASPYKPSPELVKSLRRYETLHRRCGPHTAAYSKSVPQLESHSGSHAECKYLIWGPANGLGNMMISLASAFLYALLSERVLLIDRSRDLHALFCEPFPGSSWLLPPDFPLRPSSIFNDSDGRRLGRILRKKKSTATGLVYAHLSHDYDDYDKRFFCESSQSFLREIPWVALRSDQYFSPALFLNPAYERRLSKVFPRKDTVFHHLGRYLFHPADAAWGVITGYYHDNLARATVKLGVQIRTHFKGSIPVELVTRQILNCTWTENLLPKIPSPEGRPSSIAVIVTSLYSVFLGALEDIYSGRAASTGVNVSFHQPSHEEQQQTGSEAHDVKALAEIYLLSTADALVTSAWSTFGYVANSLAGKNPWILISPRRLPACTRGASMEPCFHFPPNYDCAVGGFLETTTVLPYTTNCRDRISGLQMVDGRPT